MATAKIEITHNGVYMKKEHLKPGVHTLDTKVVANLEKRKLGKKVTAS